MAEAGVGAVIVHCAGAPGGDGWLRYLTGGQLWGGRGNVLLLRAGLTRAAVYLRSTYDAEWLRETAIETDVESTMLQRDSPVSAAVRYLCDARPVPPAVGIVGAGSFTASEYGAIEQGLSPMRLVDVTVPMSAVRRIKADVEIRALGMTRRLLSESLVRFGQAAHPGRSLLEVAGEVDGLLRARGCFWGRVACAFGEDPYPASMPPGRVLAEDDVLTVSLVYQGPEGYWAAAADVFSFRRLSPAVADRLAASRAALEGAVSAARAGATADDVAAAAAQAFGARGLRVSRWLLPVCESIGADEVDAPDLDRDPLRAGMVVRLRCAAQLERAAPFPLAETVLVREGGGARFTETEGAGRG